MGSTPVDEVQHSLEVPWGLVEKAVEGFFREEWVEELVLTMLVGDLEEVVVLMEGKEVVVVVEATLGVVAGKVYRKPVEEGEDPTTLERISKMNVATMQLDMVR